MPRRQKDELPPLPVLAPGQLLDWTNRAQHWATAERPCRYCKAPTNLRDEHREPAHKTCAETAAVQRGVDAARAYRMRKDSTA